MQVGQTLHKGTMMGDMSHCWENQSGHLATESHRLTRLPCLVLSYIPTTGIFEIYLSLVYTCHIMGMMHLYKYWPRFFSNDCR